MILALMYPVRGMSINVRCLSRCQHFGEHRALMLIPRIGYIKTSTKCSSSGPVARFLPERCNKRATQHGYLIKHPTEPAHCKETKSEIVI